MYNYSSSDQGLQIWLLTRILTYVRCCFLEPPWTSGHSPLARSFNIRTRRCRLGCWRISGGANLHKIGFSTGWSVSVAGKGTVILWDNNLWTPGWIFINRGSRRGARSSTALRDNDEALLSKLAQGGWDRSVDSVELRSTIWSDREEKQTWMKRHLYIRCGLPRILLARSRSCDDESSWATMLFIRFRAAVGSLVDNTTMSTINQAILEEAKVC